MGRMGLMGRVQFINPMRPIGPIREFDNTAVSL